MAYPIVVHAAIILEHPAVGLGALLVLLLAYIFVGHSAKESGKQSVGWGTAVGVSIVVGLVIIATNWDPTVALFLPPIAINLLLLVVFARTLLPGNEPLITQLSRLERGENPPELVSYTRRLTWVWTTFFIALVIESVLLPAYASIEVWSLFTNILNYLFIVVLFVGEYFYRIVRYGKLDHTPPLQLIISIARRGIAALVRP